MRHISESSSGEDVTDCARHQDIVQAAGANIPPDSPIRTMFVLSYLLVVWSLKCEFDQQHSFLSFDFITICTSRTLS